MELKQIVNITITAVIAIIIVMVMAVPILQDSADAYTDFKNDGVFSMGIFSPDDEYTMGYDLQTGTITVNGDIVTPIPGVGAGSGRSYSVISTENALFRFGYDAAVYSTGYYMQITGVTSSGVQFLAGGVSGTATIAGGLLELNVLKSDGTTQYIKISFNEMYAIVPDGGDAVMKVSTNSAYVLADSAVFASGLSNLHAWNDVIHFEGSYADGVTISSPNVTTAEFDNVKWNLSPVAGYRDLYALDSLEFDVIYNGNTTHVTYSYFGVPAEISAEKNIHTTGAESALISIVPMVLIVVIILAVVGSIALRRND